MDLLDPDFWLAVAVVAAGIGGLALVLRAVVRGRKEKRRYRELEAEIADIATREQVQLLRHRDLDAFTKRVNEIRARKGQEPVPKAVLAKIQYDLMYVLDESDP